jgi:phospholipid transport system substrate-binding protein
MTLARTPLLALPLLVSLAGMPSPAAAAGAPDAQAAMRATVDQAFAVLRDRALAGRERRPQRIAALRKIADRVFDWSAMARGSLGVHWRTLDPARRERFVAVFKDVLAAEYMDDIDRFQGGETVTFDSAAAQGESVLVRSTLLTASRDRVPMDYEMRMADGQWMVIDISIEGVSLVNHFRKTFANALANMTVDELIERLRRQLPASNG